MYCTPSHEVVAVFLGNVEGLSTRLPRRCQHAPPLTFLPSHDTGFVPARRFHLPGTEGTGAAFLVLDPAGCWALGTQQ